MKKIGSFGRFELLLISLLCKVLNEFLNIHFFVYVKVNEI